jgi:hypothetical protein
MKLKFYLPKITTSLGSLANYSFEVVFYGPLLFLGSSFVACKLW